MVLWNGAKMDLTAAACEDGGVTIKSVGVAVVVLAQVVGAKLGEKYVYPDTEEDLDGKVWRKQRGAQMGYR